MGSPCRPDSQRENVTNSCALIGRKDGGVKDDDHEFSLPMCLGFFEHSFEHSTCGLVINIQCRCSCAQRFAGCEPQRETIQPASSRTKSATSKCAGRASFFGSRIAAMPALKARLIAARGAAAEPHAVRSSARPIDVRRRLAFQIKPPVAWRDRIGRRRHPGSSPSSSSIRGVARLPHSR